MKSIGKNLIYTIILNVVNVLYPILTFPYVSRLLGPSGVGLVQFITTFALYFALVASLGLPIYGIREISKSKNDKRALSKTFSELIILSLISNVVVLCIYLAVIKHSYFEKDYTFYLVSSLIVFFNGISIEWFYQGIEKFKLIAVRSAVVKLVAIIGLFLFVNSSQDVFNYMLMSILAIIGNSIINLFLVVKYVRFDFRHISVQRHLKPIFFVFFYCLATSMYTMLDTIFLGVMTNSAYVGYYSAGVKLTKVFIPFITAIGISLLPQSSKAFHEKDSDSFYSFANYSFNYIISFAVPICFGLLLFSKELLIVFSGEKFYEGVVIMQVLSFLPLVIGLGHLFGVQILISAGKDKEILTCVLLGMIVNILLNVWLIPQLKHVGAAIANISCEIVITILYIYFVKKNFELKKIIDLPTFYKALISSLPFVFIYFLVSFFSGSYILTIVLGVPLCAITYFFFQFFILKNSVLIHYLRSIFKHKPMIKNER
ncbi:flippase [Limibacterium fermenti]|uniref:flippase n=1 Tax=Limibacterium fermenti TaxID=3229863 RepID=UPI003A6DA986